MREIKFRAWDKSLKKYHYPKLWDNSMPSNWKDWYELQQYTGLKDKHGKEIYSGDKLSNGKDFFFTVKWDDDSCQYILERSIGNDKTLAEMCWVITEKYEVIGNIYQTN